MDLFDRITIESGKCGGKPCMRGLRITVRRVLELLATYPDRGALFADYPFLENEDIRQALRCAAATLRRRAGRPRTPPASEVAALRHFVNRAAQPRITST